MRTQKRKLDKIKKKRETEKEMKEKKKRKREAGKAKDGEDSDSGEDAKEHEKSTHKEQKSGETMRAKSSKKDTEVATSRRPSKGSAANGEAGPPRPQKKQKRVATNITPNSRAVNSSPATASKHVSFASLPDKGTPNQDGRQDKLNPKNAKVRGDRRVGGVSGKERNTRGAKSKPFAKGSLKGDGKVSSAKVGIKSKGPVRRYFDAPEETNVRGVKEVGGERRREGRGGRGVRMGGRGRGGMSRPTTRGGHEGKPLKIFQ